MPGGRAGLVHERRPALGEPAGALVLLHGRGADEHDLRGLLDALDPGRRLLGVTPRAPLRLPPGGNHWYVVPRVGFPDPPTFHGSFAELDAFLAALVEETGIAPQRTVLGGFSQGGVMAYALGLAPGRPRPAGILALSSFIPTVEGFEPDLAGRAALPVAIGHGTLDPVIPVALGRAADERLRAAGLDVRYRESRTGHTIDPALLDELKAWLAEAVP